MKDIILSIDGRKYEVNMATSKLVWYNGETTHTIDYPNSWGFTRIMQYIESLQQSKLL